MYDEQTLRSIGRSAAAAVRHQDEWLHRRVESVTFPYPDARVYRRSVSIDFTVPDIQPIGGHAERFYIPVSLLKKWPPVLRLDLRTSAGDATPLLTSRQNGVVDAELLAALAEQALEAAGLDPQLPEDVAAQIDTLASSRKEAASRALVSLVPPDKLGVADNVHQALRHDRVFTDLAGGLRDSTVLWLRVEASRGDREIVKFSYEIPLEWRVGNAFAHAFGLQPFKADFESPHIGGTGSYHLIISAPAPLRVTDAQLALIEPQTAQGEPEVDEVIAVCSAEEQEQEVQLAHDTLELYTARAGRDARFYVTGNRTGARGVAWVALLLDKRGFPLGAAIAALAIALLLTGYCLRLTVVLSDLDSAVAVLVLVPALVAYLVVRPADHVLVSQFLRGSRLVLLGVAGLPLVGASVLVGNGAHWTLVVKIVFAALAAAAWVAAGLLGGGAWFPREQGRRPFSRHPS